MSLAVVVLAGLAVAPTPSAAGTRGERRADQPQATGSPSPTAAPLEIVEHAKFAAADVGNAPVAFVRLDAPQAYVLTTAGRLRVFNIADRDKPREVGGLTLADGTTVNTFGNQGRALYAQVSTPSEHRLDIIDATLASAPQLVRPLLLTEPFATMAVVGGRIYLGGADGLLILDATDVLHPFEIGRYNQPDVGIRALAIDGRRVYTLATVQRGPDSDAKGRGLLVLDVSASTSVTAVREYYDTKLEQAAHMAFAEGALVIGGEQGFVTLMVDSRILPFGLYGPPTLQWIWEWNSTSSSAIAGRGDRVFVVRNSKVGHVLRILDFFDPVLPVELAHFNLRDETATSIDSEGDLIALGLGASGVMLLTQHDRRAPIATLTPTAPATPDPAHAFVPFALQKRVSR